MFKNVKQQVQHVAVAVTGAAAVAIDSHYGCFVVLFSG